MGIVTLPGQYELSDPSTVRGQGRDSLYSPVRGQLDFESAIADTARQAGEGIRDVLDGAIDGAVDEIRNLTGIDLSSGAALLEQLLDVPLSILDQTPLGQAVNVLGQFLPFLHGADAGSFNKNTAASSFITGILNPAGLLPLLSGGLLSGNVIPLLDASKLGSGTVSAGRLQPLIDAVAQGMGLPTGLGFPGLQSQLTNNGNATSARWTDVFSLLGNPTGIGTGAPTVPGVGSIPLIGGLFNGTLLRGALLPLIDGSKIGSGVVSSSFLPPTPWFSSIPSALLSGAITVPVQAATDIQNTLADAVKKTGGTLQDILTGFLTLTQKSDFALASVTSAQTTAAAADQKNVPLGGAVKTILTFAGLDGAAPVAADLSVIGPAAGDLVVRANNFLGIKDGNPPGIYFGKVNHTYTGDDQAIEFTLGDNGQWNGAATYGFFHCNPEGTLGCYIKAVNDSITMGTFTRSGSTFMFTPFSGGQVFVPLKGGNLVRGRNTGTTYTPDVNRIALPSVVNSSVPFGTTRRSAWVAEERGYAPGIFGSGFGAQNYDSFRIAGVIASDFVPTAIVGSGARLVRTNAGNFTLAKNTTARFPDDFWQAGIYVSPDFVVDAKKGRIYSLKSRSIEVSARVEANGGFNGTFYLRLYKGVGTNEPVPAEKIGIRVSGGDTVVYAFAGDVGTYLNAGEYLELGYSLQTGFGASDTQLTASSDGFSIYMHVLGAG